MSASWQVPASAVSGVYLARLVRNDTDEASLVPFIVRDDAAHSAMLFQTSDATWQAYNTYGGNSLYSCTVDCPAGEPLAYKSAFKVSYNRPFNSAADDQGRSWLMYAEYPMIRFMEANGYDVSYMSGLDVSTRGPLLLNHKVFMSVGHDEYWTADQRTNVEAARDAGVNLAFLSGNEMFWKTRLEPSSDGSNTPDRTLVAYKDTHFNAPTDPVAWTGTWRDPRYGTATGGGNPENALTGQYFLVNSGTTDIVVPSTYKQLRLWRGTSIANLAAGASATLGAGLGTLGYEWDIDADNGFRPAGSFRLSNTVSSSAEVFTDYGSNTLNGQTATHNLTMYKAPSGALVFGAGTVQWSWGLDGFTTGKAPDKNMQQATVNLFADMGSQPVTIMAGLVTADASTDSTAPTSTIVSPTPGSTVSDGTIVTVSGTAADVGGVVAGVEVSTDGGTTWRPATGTSTWTYSWNAHGSPTSTLRSRAVDDSGNIESPSAGSVTNVSCPCSMIGINVSPAVPAVGDAAGIEVGAKFFSDVAGTISALRFFKSAENTGTHVGSVWSESGERLATVTFSGESATGWQSAALSPPLAVTANTKYVVSYFAPAGHYAQDTAYFYNHPSPVPAGNGSTGGAPLHFTRSLPGSPNGFYKYGASSSFPDQVYDAEYYWVDAVFSPSSSPAPALSSVSPSNSATGVDVAGKSSATFNQSVTAESVSFVLKDAANTSVQGSVAYDSATNTATFTPGTSLSFSTSYTATVSGATNSAGQSMAAPYSWTFTTAAPPAAPTIAAVSPANSASAVDTGVNPSATFDQAVTASSVVFTVKDAGNVSVA
ncbi:N,N-dimethylformamidase beta subunit family domain-containing protein, partial [Arthrobacter sp. H-02-3]|uniref:N,N-dimethylformamidase beta subunit family domain-containing protein n=1 Tax=Arthrobacter sp. H-02-3 TaxID=2703675 RepID=UPI001F313DF2